MILDLQRIRRIRGQTHDSRVEGLSVRIGQNITRPITIPSLKEMNRRVPSAESVRNSRLVFSLTHFFSGWENLSNTALEMRNFPVALGSKFRETTKLQTILRVYLMHP
jgi:hypothetical protein